MVFAFLRRKWPVSSKVFLALAVVCALLASALMHGYATKLAAASSGGGQPVTVVVAAADLSRGTTLASSSVRLEQMPTAFAPPGALTSSAQAAGRVLVADAAEGEVLTVTRVSVAGAGPVAALVPAGLRAFVVSSGLPAGAVVSGDRVDVLATFGGAHAHTETVATELEILSVLPAPAGGSMSVGGTGGEQLVLLVRSDQAEGIAYASSFGDISVTVAASEEVMPSAAPSAA